MWLIIGNISAAIGGIVADQYGLTVAWPFAIVAAAAYILFVET